MIDLQSMRGMAEDIGVQLDGTALQKLDAYAVRLVESNRIHNLTAITNPGEIAVKHFLDSMTVARFVSPGSRVIDVGTGAGFPGVVLGMICPGLRLTLLDASRKRIDFLRGLCEELSINAECVHGRAEDFARLPEYRESFDLAVSRAVADLPALCEYCLPFVRVGGIFLAMKGPGTGEEAERARRAAEILGAGFPEISSLTLPDGSARTLCVYAKRGPTPEKYPRASAQISKRPL